MGQLEVIERIRQIPGLGAVPLPDLAGLLEAGALCDHAAGDTLIDEGSHADTVLLLLEGEVSVRMRAEGGSELEIARRKAPDWLGETAALEQAERTASVVADGASQVVAIPRDVFFAVLGRHPDALLALMRTVVERRRESDAQLLAALGEQLRELRSTNRRLSFENRRLKDAVDEQHGFESFIGTSPAAQAVRAAARQAADSSLPVLLIGETGTGKEILARAIHGNSERAKRPFVALNCAHLTETLLESELFGHARGAFTGATQSKRGLVEAADGGTLFLDEVSDMPASLQGALLRFLELGEFRRLGETAPRHSRLGVIAATHRDLDEEVRAGRFRRDLMYRLDVIRVVIPPLRERAEDLPLLARHCLERTAARLGNEPLRLSPEALDSLAAYDFPGNVRELENEIERLSVALPSGSTVPVGALSSRFHTGRASGRGGYAQALASFKTQLIQRALREAGGNRAEAARQLGVHRSNLIRMMRGLGLDGDAEAGARPRTA